MRLWQMVLGMFQLAQERMPPMRPFRLASNPFIAYLLKVGVSLWFHTPSFERANQNRVQLAYSSFFIDLRSVTADCVERVMTHCQKVLTRLIFPPEIGASFAAPTTAKDWRPRQNVNLTTTATRKTKKIIK